MNKHTLENIGIELSILTRTIALFTAKKAPGNLDRSAYLLLGHITSHGSAGVKTLADGFHLDISTVSRQTATLEKKGYVYRIPDPLDRRAYSLEITPLGTKEFNKYTQQQRAKLAEKLKDWSDEDCELFAQLLGKFNQKFMHLESKGSGL